MYSNYKSHNIFKPMVGINTTVAVVLLSKFYGGSASDVEISRKSGLFYFLTSGDAVSSILTLIYVKRESNCVVHHLSPRNNLVRKKWYEQDA